MAEPTVLSFTTPKRERVRQPVPVELCGEDLVVQRPKDAVLYFAQIAAGDSVGEADQAFALVQFINALFAPADRKRFFDRLRDRDDPVHLQETLEMMTGLLDRWVNWPATGKVAPVVVEPAEHDPPADPVVVELTDFDLRFEAHPPKDIIRMCAMASLATGVHDSQIAWAVGLFLDAALEPGDALAVSHRMRSEHYDLDIGEIAEIVNGLAKHWQGATGGNRATRRATARKTTVRKTTVRKTTAGKTTVRKTSAGAGGRRRGGS